MAPVVGYWDLRGLGQGIRNLLIYKGVPFEDRRYKFGPAPDYSREDWFKEKFTLGLPFPNLPYYIDGDVKMTQSMAILRFLGRKYDLGPRNEKEASELDVLEQQAFDLAFGLGKVAFATNLDEARKKYEADIGEVLRPWDAHLQGKTWINGRRLTYVDFFFYEALDWHREFKPDAFEEFPDLGEYLTRFEGLPNIKEYMASDRYNKWPILGPMVKWGFKKE